MEPEVINKRIEFLMKYLDRLQSFESVSLDEYLNNFDLQLIGERLIQLIVEVASDINSYLLVQIYQKTPESYFESFIEAGNYYSGVSSRISTICGDEKSFSTSI